MLVTVKVRVVVATCDPPEDATAEIVQFPSGAVELSLNCVVYVPAVPVATIVLYARVPAASVT